MGKHSSNEANSFHSTTKIESADASDVGTGQPRQGDDEGAPVLDPSSNPDPFSNQSSLSNHSSSSAIPVPPLNPSLTRTQSALTPFIDGLHQLGLQLSEEQLDQFLQFRHELLDWNTRINLTAISDPDEVLIKHFLDSLSLLVAYDVPKASVLDIGAGAGFPGLPLKIVRPQWHIVLLEATGKKVKFLQHIIETLRLQEVEAIHGRAEELARKLEYRASFGLVTARAVASLPILLEHAAPFTSLGGMLIFPKKGDLTDELARGKRAATQLGARFKADMQVTLPGLDDGRRLLAWEQVRKCPENYPRSSGVIAKKPLG